MVAVTNNTYTFTPQDRSIFTQENIDSKKVSITTPKSKLINETFKKGGKA